MDLSAFKFGTAFAIAPAVPSVLYVFVALILSIANSNSTQFSILYVLLFSLPISYLSTLVLGLPTIWFLIKIGQLNIPVLSVCGAILGLGVFFLFLVILPLLLGSVGGKIPSITDLSLGFVIGFVIALAFGVISGLPRV